MDFLVARQAVFDSELHVYGYELLFRSCRENSFDGSDAAAASAQVISHSFFSLGIENILGGKRAFVNFPRELLVNESALLLPPDRIVVEILESVEEDEQVKAACLKLKERGYTLALDDFPQRRGDWLAGIVDILKIDFQQTSPSEQAGIAQLYSRGGVRLLAEKVETMEEFRRARDLGYHYFQGYFFARPLILMGREPAGFKLNYLRILEETHRPVLEFDRLERLLKRDVSLSYKLLRYINSPLFGFREPVESLREALLQLGEAEVRKWLSLVVMPRLAESMPPELVVTAVARARFCEQMARPAGLSGRAQELFLLGLFSLLDVMMDRPLRELLDQIHSAPDVRAALLDLSGPENKLAEIFALARALERAEWGSVAAIASRLGVSRERIASIYWEAVRWADQVSDPNPRPR